MPGQLDDGPGLFRAAQLSQAVQRGQLQVAIREGRGRHRQDAAHAQPAQRFQTGPARGGIGVQGELQEGIGRLLRSQLYRSPGCRAAYARVPVVEQRERRAAAFREPELPQRFDRGGGSLRVPAAYLEVVVTRR